MCADLAGPRSGRRSPGNPGTGSRGRGPRRQPPACDQESARRNLRAGARCEERRFPEADGSELKAERSGRQNRNSRKLCAALALFRHFCLCGGGAMALFHPCSASSGQAVSLGRPGTPRRTVAMGLFRHFSPRLRRARQELKREISETLCGFGFVPPPLAPRQVRGKQVQGKRFRWDARGHPQAGACGWHPAGLRQWVCSVTFCRGCGGHGEAETGNLGISGRPWLCSATFSSAAAGK